MSKHAHKGHPRGEEARQRLIQSGVEAFGTRGYESASTRGIAESANVNLGAITYYFGNKEGLYHAVAEYIVTNLEGPQLAATIASIERNLMTSSSSPKKALALLHELFDSFIDMFLSSETPEIWSQFIFRELMEPSSVFDIVSNRIVKTTVHPSSVLIGQIIDKPSDDPECISRAFMLFGQVLIFRTARRVVLGQMNCQDFDSDHVHLIRQIIHQQLDDVLKPQVSR